MLQVYIISRSQTPMGIRVRIDPRQQLLIALLWMSFLPQLSLLIQILPTKGELPFGVTCPIVQKCIRWTEDG